VTWGITYSTVITCVIYIITSIIGGGYPMWPIYSGAFLYADLQFLLGSIPGIIYTLKRCQPNQSFLKYGITVGVIGGIFSSVINSIFELFLLSLRGVGSIYAFFYVLGIFLVSGIVIGLLTGAILGTYYVYKEMKGDSKGETDNKVDDDFYQDLIDQ
jgi:uncharacterized membrane protein